MADTFHSRRSPVPDREQAAPALTCAEAALSHGVMLVKLAPLIEAA